MGIKPWHILILVVVILVLFGAKRLPDGARAIGRSLRIFKAETKGLMEDDVRGKAEAASSADIDSDQAATETTDSAARPLRGEVIDPVHQPRKQS
ncbi:MAG: Sec-independent protein translocase subunit TatA [Mycobacteriales bacterium]